MLYYPLVYNVPQGCVPQAWKHPHHTSHDPILPNSTKCTKKMVHQCASRVAQNGGLVVIPPPKKQDTQTPPPDFLFVGKKENYLYIEPDF